MNYDKVRTVTEPGDATRDVYEYIITGKKQTAFLCGPCLRKWQVAGMGIELAPWVDERYQEDGQCADCAPNKGDDQ